ncbi:MULTISPECIES: AraC family transcriptional regulator [Rhodomicrobium]|uniref:helix-turn-helix domain-containing protein n=1 Tax=Rhodomicrobium TaxID=1068 RepID=UPI000B4B6867|nr:MULTISPECIES: AraC family transcriptional regulator [Rhodomicrobium]
MFDPHSDAMSQADFGPEPHQPLAADPIWEKAANPQLPQTRAAGSMRTVEIRPSDLVERRVVAGQGFAAEIVQSSGRRRIERRFHAPLHLLVLCERGARDDGETCLDGLAPSKLRDQGGKLTFVPAGHHYYEWQQPRTPVQLTYFYFDPANLRGLADFDADEVLVPRLFFEDRALWETALKLKRLIENPTPEERPYFEALGTVLAHELIRLGREARQGEGPVKGGLAAWQQRVAAAYIEEHLAEPIPLLTLARLVRLSPHYFCRAFKQSFGVPPHRYHSTRRVEHAKALLADPAITVTEIGLRLGFSETSSFSAAFRRATGQTPTAYHRSLG